MEGIITVYTLNILDFFSGQLYINKVEREAMKSLEIVCRANSKWKNIIQENLLSVSEENNTRWHFSHKTIHLPYPRPILQKLQAGWVWPRQPGLLLGQTQSHGLQFHSGTGRSPVSVTPHNFISQKFYFRAWSWGLVFLHQSLPYRAEAHPCACALHMCRVEGPLYKDHAQKTRGYHPIPTVLLQQSCHSGRSRLLFQSPELCSGPEMLLRRRERP